MKSSQLAWPDLHTDLKSRGDAATEVAGWARRLRVLLKKIKNEISPAEVRKLLVLRGQLRRVSPDLIRKLKGGQSVLQESGERLGRLPEKSTRLAMEGIDLQKWKEEAFKLLEMAEKLPDPDEEARHSAEVLDELDEADLVLEGAGGLGYEDKELKRELEDCNRWVAENPDLFLYCGQRAQRTTLVLWQRASNSESALAKTTWKYTRIVDELEIAGKEVAFEGQESLDPGKISALLGN